MHLSAGLLKDLAQLRLTSLSLAFRQLRLRDDCAYGAERDALRAAVALLAPHDELVWRLTDGVLRAYELADAAVRPSGRVYSRCRFSECGSRGRRSRLL